MPRACTVCTHAERPAIDQDLADACSYRDIAHAYGVSKSAVMRHARHAPLAPAVRYAGHGPCTCPCTRIDWSTLADETERLTQQMQTMHSYYAVIFLRAVVGLLARLTAAASAQESSQ